MSWCCSINSVATSGPLSSQAPASGAAAGEKRAVITTKNPMTEAPSAASSRLSPESLLEAWKSPTTHGVAVSTSLATPSPGTSPGTSHGTSHSTSDGTSSGTSAKDPISPSSARSSLSVKPSLLGVKPPSKYPAILLRAPTSVRSTHVIGAFVASQYAEVTGISTCPKVSAIMASTGSSKETTAVTARSRVASYLPPLGVSQGAADKALPATGHSKEEAVSHLLLGERGRLQAMGSLVAGQPIAATGSLLSYRGNRLALYRVSSDESDADEASDSDLELIFNGSGIDKLDAHLTLLPLCNPLATLPRMLPLRTHDVKGSASRGVAPSEKVS